MDNGHVVPPTNQKPAWFFDTTPRLTGVGPEGPGVELGQCLWYRALKDLSDQRPFRERRSAALWITVRNQAPLREFGGNDAEQAPVRGRANISMSRSAWI